MATAGPKTPRRPPKIVGESRIADPISWYQLRIFEQFDQESTQSGAAGASSQADRFSKMQNPPDEVRRVTLLSASISRVYTCQAETSSVNWMCLN